jgi:hypothetical protein
LNSAEFQRKTCQEGALEEVTDSGRIIKVVEHLGGKTVQRRAQRISRISENFVRFYQEGIKRMHRMN